jgi:hypothetical protein
MSEYKPDDMVVFMGDIKIEGFTTGQEIKLDPKCIDCEARVPFLEEYQLMEGDKIIVPLCKTCFDKRLEK